MTDRLANPFQLCPLCGSPQITIERQHELRCPACGFRYFHNVAATAGALLEHEGRYLFVVRGHEPAKGKLGVPGGFVDPYETMEAALAREVHEEVGGEIGPATFVASFPNRYTFAGITYHTCDCYFRAPLLTAPDQLRPAPGEIDTLRWLRLDEVQAEDFGFPSLVALWRKMRANR